MMNNPFMIMKLNPFPMMMSINIFSFILNINKLSLMMMMILMINTMYINIKWMNINSKINLKKSTMNSNYILNMKLIIITEVMFFSSFMYMNMSMKMFPSPFNNNQWPINFFIMNYYISLMNTLILMNSSISITMTMIMFKKKFILITNFLGMYFSMIQFYEYLNMNFNINNSSYWSIYYSMTMFHSMHVLMGLIIMNISLKKIKMMMMINNMMFKMIIWYWHFVDLVWISIFFMFY